jgi:pseudouridine synthase
MPEERLQKMLARAGVASRRRSEELIAGGRVTVNGEVVTSLGTKVDPARDVVAVDGTRVEPQAVKAYFALNKPRGFVTTMSDPQGRRTIAEFLPDDPPGLFAVGRLDLDTEGLLIVTNDGELADRLMHPRHHVSKTYRVVVAGCPAEAALHKLRDGIVLDDGPTQPAEVRLVAAAGKTAELLMTIHEGRKRQVRRMFGAIRHPVVSLRRIALGPIRLGDQRQGTLRLLTDDEVAALKRDAGI